MALDDVPKNKPVRGPDGRFMSKKNSADTPKSLPAKEAKHPDESVQIVPITEELTVDTQEAATQYSHVFFNDLSYYGEYIRRTYRNNQWFFVVDDLLPLANVTEPLQIMSAFMNSPYYKETFGTDIFEIEIPKNNLGQTHLTIGNKKSVLEFASLLRGMSHFFPGRFPEWIEETSNIDYNEAEILRNKRLAQQPN